jgi:hypothetical protein
MMRRVDVLWNFQSPSNTYLASHVHRERRRTKKTIFRIDEPVKSCSQVPIDPSVLFAMLEPSQRTTDQINQFLLHIIPNTFTSLLRKRKNDKADARMAQKK